MNWSQIENWITNPQTQYVPLNRVQFLPYAINTGYELPPIGTVFPQPQFNKMLNIPSSMQTIYNGPRRPFG